MGSIFETVLQQLGGDTMKRIGTELGTDEQTAGSATAATVSTLLGALSRNAADKNGAEALHRALAKDHDGSLLDNLSGFLGQAQQGPGEGILRHVLGERRPQIESGIGRTSGLDSGSVSKLMTMVAPVVMAALGKQQRSGGLESRGLANMLGQERSALEQAQPQAMGLIGKLLDSDGDGDFDIKDGIGMLGKLFKR